MVPGTVTLIPLYKIVATLGWLNTPQGLAVPWMALAVRPVRLQAVHGVAGARAARRGRDRRGIAQYYQPPSHATIEVVMTAAFMAALPPIVFYAFLQRYIIQGIALMGLKG
jgi:ABC-type glycerol-3-phosphate transport system permease component